MSVFSSAIPAEASFARIEPGQFAGGTVSLPGSKSLTNRALLISSMIPGESILRNGLDCDDSRHLCGALKQLGVSISSEAGGPRCGSQDALTFTVRGGILGYSNKKDSFLLGNAGTATRFLTAALAASGGEYVVDGDERMRERPINQLVEALRDLGAEIRCPTGCPPVTIGPRGLQGGRVNMAGNTSSQFISAVLMAAPLASESVEVRLVGEILSAPYLDLTLRTMQDFGVRVDVHDDESDGQLVYHIDERKEYKERDYFVEGDASTASYFFAAAALTGTTVRVEGVGKVSRQGDLRFADVLAEMGCHVKKDVDSITVSGPEDMLGGVVNNCADMPDIVPTLAVVGAFSRGRTRLHGVPHLRYKESDRIASVASELRKLGVDVKELDDGLEINGPTGPDDFSLHGGRIDSWGDHRIAMAFSLPGLLLPGVEIGDPQVVTKSYPGFFTELATLGGRSTFHSPGGKEVVAEESPS